MNGLADMLGNVSSLGAYVITGLLKLDFLDLVNEEVVKRRSQYSRIKADLLLGDDSTKSFIGIYVLFNVHLN